MADETVLIKVEIDNSDTIAALEKNKVAIVNLKKEQQDLNKAFKDGNITTKEYASESVRVEQLTKKHTQTYSKLTHELQGTKSWTDNLKDSMKAQSATMDKLSGGLVSTAHNVTGLTKGMSAFVAVPAVAVAVALGVALGSLMAYFKGSEEGQDRLAKVTAVLGVAFEKVMQVVEKLGEVVFDTIEFIATGFKNVIAFFSPVLGQMLDEAIATGEQIASMQDAVDARENELIVKRAETGKQVAELRRAAIALEGAEKKKVIEQAIALEEELSRVETEQAANRLAAYEKEIEGKGLKTEEEKTRIAELTAAKINAEAQAAEATLRFQKELEKINEADREIREAQRRADSELFEQGKIQETEIVIRELDIQTLSLDTSLKAQQAMIANAIAAKAKAREKEQAAAIKDQQTQTRIAELEAQNRLMIISQTLGQAQALFEKDSVAHKFLGVARATVDTYVAANLALSTYPPPFGAIAAAASIATGLANVTKILDIGFAEGGYTGDGGKHEVAGVVHRGEYVVPKHIVQNPMYSGYISTLEGARNSGYADGGLVTNSATAQIEQQAMMAKAFEGAQFWVSWTEGQQMGKSVEFKDRLVTI